MGEHTTSMQETLQKRLCAIQRQRRNISNNQKRTRKMKKIICKFKSDGKEVSKTAIINDSLDTLSISKKSEATDIIEPDTFDYEEWSIYFEVTDTLAYEVVFKYDQESHIKTLKPIKAITWDGTDIDHVVITDVQKVSITIR
jgi:hypothetical protein